MPAAVWMMRGAAWPAMGSREMPLVTKPPMLVERDDLFELDAVAEGAAGGDHRIDQFEARQTTLSFRFHARHASLKTVNSGQ
jgi:hypothetical protein